MNDIDIPLLLSRWLHISAAILAIGGAAFMALALLPAARDTLDEPAQERLREAIRRRWSKFVLAAIALLLLTGAFNFWTLALAPKIKPMPYHAIFGVKFLAAMVIFFVASALVGRSPGVAGMRKNAGRALTLILVLAALVVLLSGLLNRVRSSQPPPAPVAMAAIVPTPEWVRSPRESRRPRTTESAHANGHLPRGA